VDDRAVHPLEDLTLDRPLRCVNDAYYSTHKTLYLLLTPRG